MGFFDRIAALRRGFLSRSVALYGRPLITGGHLVSDYQENAVAVCVNRPYHGLLDNKVVFGSVVGPSSPVVPVLAVVAGSRVFLQVDDCASIEELVRRRGELILKPIDGSGGEGVALVRLRPDGYLSWNDRSVDSQEFVGLLRSLGVSVVNAVVRPGAYARAIAPWGLSTVRVLTMIDPTTGEPFIAAAAHRFVTRSSAPVDNCAAGGLTAVIDQASGVLGRATVTVVSRGVPPAWFASHPDSHAPIEGVVVPRWADVTELALDLARRLSICPYVGWDIVVTDDAVVVLEGNDGPDLKLHQVHQPLLKDERVRCFYEHHRVLRRRR